MKNLKETEDMAKTKINTLELEIAQQSIFYKNEQDNYDKQIKMLREEIWGLREADGKYASQIDSIINTKNDL